MNFGDFIAGFENENEQNINEDLIYNLRDEDLHLDIIEVLKSLECRNIKMLGWELITDESKINPNKVIKKHIKNKKNRKFLNRMNMKHSRYNLLRTHFEVNFKDEYKEVTMELLLFKKVNKYYYLINGNQYYPIYQLLDASTYSSGRNSSVITLKTLLLPIVMKRNKVTLEDLNGNEYEVPYYTLHLFKKKINPLIYYFGTAGYINTMRFMDMEDLIFITDNDDRKDDPEYLVFKINDNLYLSVYKYFFENDFFVQNMCYALIDINKECASLNEIHNLTEWMVKLGELFSSKKLDRDNKIQKAKSVSFSFNRLLDGLTKKALRLENYNKYSMFHIVRWMMRHFSSLKSKNNMDLANKRIRLSEYMAAYLMKDRSTKMNKLLSSSKRELTLKDFESLINVDQHHLIKLVTGSKKPILRYDNTVNDMDFFTSLKYTIKGPNSLGENSSNSISPKFRALDASYVGRLDLNTCGSTDPGMTGIFVPFCKTYGKYFTEKHEPQGWDKRFIKMYENYFEGASHDYKSLNYFYKREEQTEEAMFYRLDDFNSFIKDDPYNSTGEIELINDDRFRVFSANWMDESKKKKSKKKFKFDSDKGKEIKTFNAKRI